MATSPNHALQRTRPRGPGRLAWGVTWQIQDGMFVQVSVSEAVSTIVHGAKSCYMHSLD